MIASETNFFAEVSNEGISFFFQNDEDKTITGLSVFTFENKKGENNIAHKLQKIFNANKLLTDKFNKVFISYGFNESILTPGLYYNPGYDNENLNLVFGDLHQGIILTDHVAEKNLYNTYRIPDNVHQAIISQFNQAVFVHQYSLLIKQLQHTGSILKVIFYQNKIVCSLLKEGKLQIIQVFNYITAEDVLYKLLNVCSLFNINDVSVQLCGMIEKDSALFRALGKYFLSITFPDLPETLFYSDEIKTFPAHFFNHLFGFALCV